MITMFPYLFSKRVGKQKYVSSPPTSKLEYGQRSGQVTIPTIIFTDLYLHRRRFRLGVHGFCRWKFHSQRYIRPVAHVFPHGVCYLHPSLTRTHLFNEHGRVWSLLFHIFPIRRRPFVDRQTGAAVDDDFCESLVKFVAYASQTGESEVEIFIWKFLLNFQILLSLRNSLSGYRLAYNYRISRRGNVANIFPIWKNLGILLKKSFQKRDNINICR